MFMNVLRPYRPSFRNWLKKNLKKKDQPLGKSGRLGKKMASFYVLNHHRKSR